MTFRESICCHATMIVHKCQRKQKLEYWNFTVLCSTMYLCYSQWLLCVRDKAGLYQFCLSKKGRKKHEKINLHLGLKRAYRAWLIREQLAGYTPYITQFPISVCVCRRWWLRMKGRYWSGPSYTRGAHSGTKWLPTAKRLCIAEVVNAKIW